MTISSVIFPVWSLIKRDCELITSPGDAMRRHREMFELDTLIGKAAWLSFAV